MVDLKSFESSNLSVSVRAHVHRDGQALNFNFKILDPKHEVLEGIGAGHWSALSRADGLWQSTCLEAFWREPGEAAYWELNLSPHSPRWNLYRFDSYRNPQPPTASFDFELEDLRASVGNLSARLRTERPLFKLQMSLAAVIKTSAGTSYFAAAHAAAKPDFHDARSFIISV